MLFSSLVFIFCFLPTMVLLYNFRRNINYRNTALLLGSVLFYFYGEGLRIWILFLTVGITYFSALQIYMSDDRALRKAILFASVSLNLCILIYFKYFAFFIHSINRALISTHFLKEFPELSIALPLGVSFFTFHAISYLIDTYRGKVVPTKSFSIASLYFFLFPHQIAGPIVRYELFASQINNRTSNADDISKGIERFIIGLSKKVLIANSAAQGSDFVFGLNVKDISSPVAWIGIICYAIQIYFDFSGYSDMAIGLARIFGFHFHENFEFPYRSISVTEFWRRWHISLSTWFRDYLYIPLGGNRVGRVRNYINLFTVFVLCGLWHGANWTFLIWGLWHGMLLVIEKAGMEKLVRKSAILGWLWTSVLVLIGWVFFKCETTSMSLHFIARMFNWKQTIGDSAFQTQSLLANHQIYVGLALGALFALGHVSRILIQTSQKSVFLYGVFRFAILITFVLCLVRLADGTFNPFIYFRF